MPRDDFALTLMDVRWIEQEAATPPYQEFRPPCADRIVAAPPRRGLARLVFAQQRQGEDVAPHLPCGRDLFWI